MTVQQSRSRLQVDSLEERTTPAVWGNPWPDPRHMTVSFAPDGTDVGGRPSALFSHLGSGLAERDWQFDILRAFQTWAAVGNINLTLVGDSGAPLGAPGPAQGSSAYGDVRVGTRPLSGSELAVGTPFDQFGSWSGEVLFNSGYAFNRGGGPSAYDLYTVALQEAGHVFGLPNSPAANSVMFTQYLGARFGLADSDVADLQQLYGVRSHDRFDQLGPNGARTAASPIRFVTDARALRGFDPTAGSAPYVVDGDVTTTADKDFYRFTVPAGATDFFVQLRTSGVSLLQARVNVFDSTGRLVQSVTAADPRSGDLSLYVAGVKTGATYFVQVESGTADPFGVGGYRLAVGTAAHAAVFPAGSTFVNPDWHGNDSPASATGLGVTRSDGSPAWDLTHRAAIEDPSDRDFYKFQTGRLTGGALVLSVWASDPGRRAPVVRVYDAAKNLIPAEVLANDGTYYSLQVRNAPANAVLFVEVAAADPVAGQEGNYFLAVDHRAQPVGIGRLAAGTLTDASRQQGFELTTTRDHLFRFSVSASAIDPAVEAAVRMTVYDGQNRVVASIVANAGGTAGLDLLLAAGTYRVKISGATRDPAVPLPDLAYTLDGGVRNDPIGPEPEDPTAAPVGGQPPTTAYTLIRVTDTWLTWLDAYSNPWFGV